MKAAHYFDIILRGRPGGPKDLEKISQKTLRVLHGFLANHPEIKIALSFPEYSTEKAANFLEVVKKIRFFSDSQESLEIFMTDLKKAFENTRLNFTDVQAVPESFVGEYQYFSRYRIKVRNTTVNREKNFRLMQMQQADNNGMLFFNVKSNSNQNSFRLYINETKSFAPADALNHPGKLNNYGLSVGDNPCWLPVLAA